MPHRSHEWPHTLAQLRLAFADSDHFTVHPPVPPPFGDEGAANHMRLAAAPGMTGVEIFIHGTVGGPFPARQSLEACRAVARLHGLDPARTLFVAQSAEAIAGGAFHNDVVAVADGMTLFAHEQAFNDPCRFRAQLAEQLPEVRYVEVPASEVSLEDAIRSYLFNAQLVTLPTGGQALVLPSEARETPSVWRWLETMVASNGPIRQLHVVDVRQSMANGGGPACLRLRVVADPARIDPRFIVDQELLGSIENVVTRFWPEYITAEMVSDPTLWEKAILARRQLLYLLNLDQLL